jgi:ubiquitin-protein ligase
MLARQRLARERKDWRKSHPAGFFARPIVGKDGTADLFKWKCGIPGPEGSPWEGGLYTLDVTFPDDYPTNPPNCK